MTAPSFERSGDAPALRTDAPAWPCPFCGAPTLILSGGDIADDRDRVEVYCDNSDCDAREITVLIMRGEGAHDRADVQALQAVDEGSRAEQEAEGVELGPGGSRASRFTDYVPDVGGKRKLSRRVRPTRIVIEPVETSDAPD